jgi:glucose-6-phosphate 1-dehydrogenase
MPAQNDIAIGGAAPGRPGDPCILAIFGAAGDLTRRKLIPALYNLKRGGLLNDHFAVVGLARRDLDTDRFRDQMMKDLKEFAPQPLEMATCEDVVRRIHYLQGTFICCTTSPPLRKRSPRSSIGWASTAWSGRKVNRGGG